MTTTEAYVVTDLHPRPELPRRIPWRTVGRFVRADLLALAWGLQCLGRGIRWWASQPTDSPVGVITIAVFKLVAVVVAIVAAIAIMGAIVSQLPEPTQQDRVHRIGIWVSQGATWSQALQWDMDGFQVDPATAKRDVEDARTATKTSTDT